jgi:hypothetical protein
MVECLSQKIYLAKSVTRMGRPQAATKQYVLQAIHNHKTTSPSKLAAYLNVTRATIYRRLQQISANEISEALGIICEEEHFIHHLQEGKFSLEDKLLGMVRFTVSREGFKCTEVESNCIWLCCWQVNIHQERGF